MTNLVYDGPEGVEEFSTTQHNVKSIEYNKQIQHWQIEFANENREQSERDLMQIPVHRVYEVSMVTDDLAEGNIAFLTEEN
ncbi:hypothetical protein [Halohasta litorea]|uniref:Uncharacterized protein n=1 Tax=Halohasta litorea TaxID=869891 RepID=A0ABD6DC20_9EURY|nr:hypothetical protein [Halohasta litorea]